MAPSSGTTPMVSSPARSALREGAKAPSVARQWQDAVEMFLGDGTRAMEAILCIPSRETRYLANSVTVSGASVGKRIPYSSLEGYFTNGTLDRRGGIPSTVRAFAG